MPGKEDFGGLWEVSLIFRNRHVKYEKIRADEKPTSPQEQKESKKDPN